MGFVPAVITLLEARDYFGPAVIGLTILAILLIAAVVVGIEVLVRK
jgi:hypothetical protein